MADSYYAWASETMQIHRDEVKRLNAIADAAEALVAHRGSAREDEMWAMLDDALFPPTCKSGEEEESK